MAIKHKQPARERHFYFIADGQINLGFVAQADKAFTASDVKGRKIGIFQNLQAAADAVDDTYRATLRAPAPKKRKERRDDRVGRGGRAL
jgi:hypothetical protein